MTLQVLMRATPNALSVPPSVKVFYWKSGAKGGKNHGHISAQIDSVYLSLNPLQQYKKKVGFRKDIVPGLGPNTTVYRNPPTYVPNLEWDVKKLGREPDETLIIPPELLRSIFCKNEAHAINTDIINTGPVIDNKTYYQICDSEKDKNDRSNCATSVSQVVSAGVSREHPDFYKDLQKCYDPDTLRDCINKHLLKFYSNLKKSISRETSL